MSQIRRLRSDSLSLDLESRQLTIQGVESPLQEQPFRLLCHLMMRAPNIVTRRELHAAIWPESVVVDYERGLTVNVNKLRSLLRRAGEEDRIVTLRGRGYRFEGDVQIQFAEDRRDGVRQVLEIAEQRARSRRPRDLRRALKAYAQLIDLVPESSEAWAGMGSCLALLADFQILPAGEGFARAEAAAERALRLRKDSSLALSVQAFVRHRRDWQLDSAEALYRRADELPGSNGIARQWLAELLSQRGRHDEALRILRGLREEQALGPAAAVEPWLLLHAGKPREALARCRTLRRLGENSLLLDYLRARVDDDEARALALALRCRERGRGAGFVGAELIRQLSRNGEAGAAERLLPEIRDSYQRAKALLAMGRQRQAVEELRRAADSRSPWLLDLRVDPDWDELRDSGIFRAVQARIPT